MNFKSTMATIIASALMIATILQGQYEIHVLKDQLRYEQQSFAKKVAAYETNNAKQAMVIDHLHNRLRSGHGQGVAAEGCAVAAGGQRICHRLSHQDRAHRHAAAQALGTGQQVWPDPQAFMSPKCACAPDAGLHLIKDQQQAMGIGQGTDPLQEISA